MQVRRLLLALAALALLASPSRADAPARHDFKLVYDLDAVDLDRRVGEHLLALVKQGLDQAKIAATVELAPGGANIAVVRANGKPASAAVEKQLAGRDDVLATECPKKVSGRCFRASEQVRRSARFAALEAAREHARARLLPTSSYSVYTREGRLFVEAEDVTDVELASARVVIEGRLDTNLRLTAGKRPEWAGIVARVKAEGSDTAVTAETDVWEKGPGAYETETYLAVADQTLGGWRRIARQLAAFGFSPDADHEVVYGRTDDGKGWRAYYLRRPVELGGAQLVAADLTWNPSTGRPEVMVTMSPEGSQRLEASTRANVGRKLALVSDGEVIMAPVIIGPIPGPRLTVTLGSGQSMNDLEKSARETVAVFRRGSDSVRLAAPKVEVTQP